MPTYLKHPRSVWHHVVFGLVGLIAAWPTIPSFSWADEPPATKAEAKPGEFLDAIPHGYFLHAYDDCGYLGRQPHVDTTNTWPYIFQFSVEHPEDGLKPLSVVNGLHQVEASYHDLDPSLCYVLAVTYASDDDTRVQSLWANGIQLHGPYPLPRAKTVRLIVPVPASAIQKGTLSLEWRREGLQNVVVSIVELWANAPPRDGDPLVIERVSGLFAAEVTGRVLDRAFDAVADATVELRQDGQAKPLATATSQADGWFSLSKAPLSRDYAGRDLEITAHLGSRTASYRIATAELAFDPVRYRPVPTQVTTLAEPRQSLDGTWKLAPVAKPELRVTSLDSADWNDFRVPGQWRQQGLDIPQTQTAAMAREFTVPQAWCGHRVILRFDAIHAGVQYWFNGHKLGSSENLFTPVEWDITPWVRFDGLNRLDLEMQVETLAERLSYSSAYAYHSLGGIDRAVRIYALPDVQIRALHLSASVDQAYRDGWLQAAVTVENLRPQVAEGLTLSASLEDAQGHAVALATSQVNVGALAPGSRTVELSSAVTTPLKWTAETAH